MFKFSKTIRALVALLSAAAGAQADTFFVSSTLDFGPGTLRSAIDQANANPGPDVVQFHPLINGTTRLNSTIHINEAVSIIGNGPANTVITCQTGDSAFSILGAIEEFGLLDLSISNCAGGAMFVIADTRLNFHRCVFEANGGDGAVAGVFNTTAVIRLTGKVHACSFVGNSGIYSGLLRVVMPISSDRLDFVNCTMHGNSSTQGPALIYIQGSSGQATQGGCWFHNCTITGNTSGSLAGTGYGAIHIEALPQSSAGPIVIWASVFAENTAGPGAESPNFTGAGSSEGVTNGSPNVYENAGLGPIQSIDGLLVRVPQPGSVCIDAAASLAVVRVDALGNRRPMATFNTLGGADIGAVESAATDACPADFDGDGAVAVPDIFAFLTDWFAGCP